MEHDTAPPAPTPDQALVAADAAVQTALVAMAAAAQDYARQAKSANTQRAYRADWADFDAWCARHGLAALPATPTTVALCPTDRATTHTMATLARRLVAIAQVYQAAGRPARLRRSA